MTAAFIKLKINNADKHAASVTCCTVKLTLIVTVIPTFQASGA